jgi:hypothetical protein
MSLNDSRIAINTYLNDSLSSTIALAFEGDDNRAMALDRGTDPWIYFYILWTDKIQKSSPSPLAKFTQLGSLQAKLYVRKEDGMGLLDQLSDTYSSYVIAKQLNNTQLYDLRIGRTDANDTWRVRFFSSGIRIYSNESILPA